jgi:hypothetical protein
MNEEGAPPVAGRTFRSADLVPTPSAGRIALASVVALVVAAAILLAVVLPAEYGLDYLGAGRALGLVAMGEQRPGVLATQPNGYRVDRKQFVIGPFQAVEYKYRLEQGDSMVFSWTATAPVISDLHSQPDGAPEGYAESFDRHEGAGGHGTYTAPFGGIHGWYWENPNRDDVTITLTSSGFYSRGIEFFAGAVIDHDVGTP